MERFFQMLQQSPGAQGEPTLESTGLALLLAFSLGQLFAWFYSRTHAGISYSRTFTQSLVLIMMVVALALHVIGNNIVTAFGLIGALAIIRFRNVLKDTRDTAFVFFSLIIGMAVGVGRYSAALVGTAGLLLAVLVMEATRFGSRGHFDGHLSLQVVTNSDEKSRRRVLDRFCRKFREVSVRMAGGGDESEVILRVRLRDRRRGPELLEALNELAAVRRADLILRDELAEI
jgi:uncharacterized membrane protein YhiD involved in acid resistance